MVHDKAILAAGLLQDFQKKVTAVGRVQLEPTVAGGPVQASLGRTAAIGRTEPALLPDHGYVYVV